MIKKVQKRNSLWEDFDFSKIEKAVSNAYNEVGRDMESDAFHGQKVLSELKKRVNDAGEEVSINFIQDMIEETLFKFTDYFLTKAYITYRYKRDALRQQAKGDIEHLERFIESSTTADATIDDNANVRNKTMAGFNAEVHKEKNASVNLALWEKEMKRMDPNFDRKKFEKMIGREIYLHDLSSKVLQPYCMAVSLYPVLLDGMKTVGEGSAAPKWLSSFCGIYINLLFALAGEVKGAVATPEFLMYFTHFAEKDLGEDFYKREEELYTSDKVKHKLTIGEYVDQCFQWVTHSINQSAGNRGAQSPFTNFSFFDKYFFEAMFGDFVFPDGEKPKWESVNWIQQRYLRWLNQERLKTMLTFPVCSYAVLVDKDKKYKDKETYEFIAKELAEMNSFFVYVSSSVDSLSSCCRLQNAVDELQFTMTNGQIGVMTGSKQVETLNVSRLVSKVMNDMGLKSMPLLSFQAEALRKELKKQLREKLDEIHFHLKAYNNILLDLEKKGMYKAYSSGYIRMDKQYLTVGINGVQEAAIHLGMEISPNTEYASFCKFLFEVISESNREARTKECRFNTEFVPAESAAIKLYNADKEDQFWVPEDRNLYYSYPYSPADKKLTVFDRLTMSGSEFGFDKLDGGSAAHINIDCDLTVNQTKKILDWAAKVGCKYFTLNRPNTECDDCGYIIKKPVDKCPVCGSSHLSYWDRVIGYLAKVSNWSAGRREEFKTRVFSKEV